MSFQCLDALGGKTDALNNILRVNNMEGSVVKNEGF